MQKVKLFFIAFVLVGMMGSFNIPQKEEIRWLTVAELQSAYSKQPRPVLVDVYTSWCGWCKVMERETYTNDHVVEYINTHYYAVKLDAERKDSVVWADKKYGYVPAYKSNELALYLLGGRMSFPTTVFMTSLDAQPAALPGYQKVKEIESPLKYFGEGVYKKMSYVDYYKTFSSQW
jgi:thioredoxin-related protein